MITIQHTETERNGLFEAWLDGTQVGEMTYQRPTLEFVKEGVLRIVVKELAAHILMLCFSI